MLNLVQKYKLQSLINAFEVSKDDFSQKIENLLYKLNTKTLEMILDMIKDDKNIMVSLKWLILLHFTSLQGSEKNIDLRNKILNELKIDQTALSSFQQVLYNKLFIPYKMYIQKRNIFSLVKESKQFKFYQILNMIRQALSFTNVMYMVGRYILKQHPFMRFFGILIAKDMKYMYKILRLHLTQKICMQNAEVLQKMNEGLYNIYYNCYFSKFLAGYAPVWLNTQTIFKQLEEYKKTHPNPINDVNSLKKSKTQKYIRTWQQLQDKQTQKSMIFEMFSEKDQIQALSLQEIPQDSFSDFKFNQSKQSKEFISNSTIASKESREQYGKQTISRLQFIEIASKFMQEIEAIENQSQLL